MRVAVIGAGVSGLGAAKCLLDEGLVPTVFEKSDRIGGLWNSSSNGGKAYLSLHTNTSTQITPFSDFPFKNYKQEFIGYRKLLSYLNDYAYHFGLLKYIHFGTKVISAKSIHGNKWKITIERNGKNLEELFDAVIVASGEYGRPRMPKVKGAKILPAQ